MIRSLWIAKTGLDAQQTNLDVISNNLANVNTTGFKRSRAIFEDLLYQNMRQTGANSSQQSQLPTGLQIGTGVRSVATERLHTQGNLQSTGNSLDLAIQGGGFFQVTMPDGRTAYTRDGSFHTDANGQIVTSSGYPISPAVQIPANTQNVTFGRDGTISVTAANGTSQQLGQISMANFMNPAGLETIGENLMIESASSGQPTVGTPGANGMGAVTQGYVETSNVNVVEELVSMIQTQRAYEINSKAIQTSDQMLQKIGQL